MPCFKKLVGWVLGLGKAWFVEVVGSVLIFISWIVLRRCFEVMMSLAGAEY